MSQLNNSELLLYMRVYQYYRDLIVSGQLKKGDRLPSVRRCAQLLQLSRNTVETAYLLLAADGYILSKPQSGYYVMDIPGEERKRREQPPAQPRRKVPEKPRITYDFSTQAVDRGSFDFNIWRRYIKSALRQDERLLSYGEPQGEWELRCVLAEYVSRNRNVVCGPEDIVVGAGTQSLLQVLCPLLRRWETVSVPTPSFSRSGRIFEDYGYELHYRDKDAGIVYVAPSHMNQWGETMPVKRRLELLEHAALRGSIIIEDDYESEFQYLHRPVPALQSLSGGRGVVYLGTFSKLLLPSIRLSYMVLPRELADAYRERAASYNQTASKTEQIALCQFIRDGHLEAQVRKLRRLYEAKTDRLCECLKRAVSGAGFTVERGCLCAVLTLNPCGGSPVGYPVQDAECLRIAGYLERRGIRLGGVFVESTGARRAVFSSLGVDVDGMEAACEKAVGLLADAVGHRRAGAASGEKNETYL